MLTMRISEEKVGQNIEIEFVIKCQSVIKSSLDIVTYQLQERLATMNQLEKLKFAGGCAAAVFCWLTMSLGQSTMAQSEHFNVSHDTVTLVRPGTRVGDTVPRGWSHLVLKSNPNVTKGDVKDVSNSDKKMSSMVRTVSLANVFKRRIGSKDVFQLREVALGLCLNIKGVDTVASPDTQSKLGGGLGFIQRTVFSTIYKEQKRVHYVARSDYSVIYDAPMIIRVAGKNSEHVCRYAIMVDPASGKLTSTVWLIETDSRKNYKRVLGKVNVMPQSNNYKCDLYVDSNQYTFGIPSKLAYACVSIAPGEKSIDIPDSVSTIAAKANISSNEAAKLVAALRKEVAEAK